MAPHGAPGQVGPGLEGRRVLIVEDSPDNLRLLTLILTRAGAHPSAVENGRLAVDAVRTAIEANRPFEAILLDMQMPVMDGYSAAREIRKLGFNGPLLAVTADTTERARIGCLEAGCDEYLTKPVDRHLLINVLQRHMLLAQLRAASVDQPLMWE